jgi:hypothetical protein
LILLKTILDRLRTLWQYGKLERSLDSFSNECRGWSRSDFVEESLDRVADWFRNPAYLRWGIPYLSCTSD